MRLLGVFLTLCVALAALKAAVTLVAVVVIGAVVFSLATRPAETIGYMLMVTLLGAISRHPVLGLLLLSGSLILTRLAENRSRSKPKK